MTLIGTGGRTAINGIRIALGIGGAIALVVGLLILLWPTKAAAAVTALIAVYAIGAGLVYAAIGVFSKFMGGWARVGHVVVGLLFVISGVVMLANLGPATEWFALFFGVLVGIMWIVDGVVALTTLSDSASKVWSLFYALISVVAGVVILLSPLWGALLLWLLLGISLFVLGILQIVRALTFGRRA